MENSNQSVKILVTRTAGFIGYYLTKRLLEQNCEVVGIDNLNDYYDVGLKRARLDLLKPYLGLRACVSIRESETSTIIPHLDMADIACQRTSSNCERIILMSRRTW